MSVLERGGNAFDAAAAAGFTLQVVEPHLNGPGGDLPILLWSETDGVAHVVCGQGVAPAAASIAHYTNLGLDQVPGSGLLAATVPGAFGAWTEMLERWGTWELDAVLEYALHYAETGYPILPTISSTIASVHQLLLDHWPTSAQLWLDHGAVPAPGVNWTSPGLAATYRRVLVEAVGSTREQRIGAARQAWYSGFVAEEIGKFCGTAWRDTSGRDHAGLLTSDDLANWSATVEPAIGVDFAGQYEVLKTAAWGQGPVLAQQLRLLEACDILSHEVRSVEWIHLVVEASKLSFADREAYYGDPDFTDVPVGQLLARAYAMQRSSMIEETASYDLRPGTVADRSPRLPRLLGQHQTDTTGAAGEPTVGRLGQNRGDTCHLDVVDRYGNFVSATPSGGWLQSSPTIPSLGFSLGTRAQMFYLEPDLPNSLRSTARPRTTLSPTLVLRDGLPWMACGTPGGDQQDQWQNTFLLDILSNDLKGRAQLQDSIDAPNFHSTHFPSSFYPREAHPGEVVMESRLSQETFDKLRERGHIVVAAPPWSLGRLSAVTKRGDDMRAAANARGAQGYAVGR